MLTSLPVSLLVGTVLGFLSGLGIGGGSLLILWLTMVLDMEQSAARFVNLLFLSYRIQNIASLSPFDMLY